jgi:hypothetical protein
MFYLESARQVFALLFLRRSPEFHTHVCLLDDISGLQRLGDSSHLVVLVVLNLNERLVVKVFVLHGTSRPCSRSLCKRRRGFGAYIAMPSAGCTVPKIGLRRTFLGNTCCL